MPTPHTVENPCIIFLLSLSICHSTYMDSVYYRSYSTTVYIYWKNSAVSGTIRFKLAEQGWLVWKSWLRFWRHGSRSRRPCLGWYRTKSSLPRSHSKCYNWGVLCIGAPHIILLLQNLKAVWESLLNLLSELPLRGLTDANKNIKLINKSKRGGQGDNKEKLP